MAQRTGTSCVCNVDSRNDVQPVDDRRQPGVGDTATESVASPPANAAAGNLEEIVVTARKRSEREIDVPTSVTAIAPEALERYASTDLTSIGNMVSQVSIDHSPTGSGALITIRGVTAGANSDASIEQDVTINIDGVPTSRGGSWKPRCSICKASRF